MTSQFRATSPKEQDHAHQEFRPKYVTLSNGHSFLIVLKIVYKESIKQSLSSAEEGAIRLEDKTCSCSVKSNRGIVAQFS